MSLRSKLVLAFMAFVSLLLGVGVTSLLVNQRIQSDVAGLRSSRGVDLRHVDLDNSSLEIEGFWDRSGIFVARDVAVIPGTRQPKLRGEIQYVDTPGRTLTLYGVSIHVPAETEFIDAGAENRRFEDLTPGMRIEVSSRIDGDRWTARKIKTRNVKDSDKLKGTATAAELDGKAPETLELQGITVSLAPPKNDSPQGILRRIEGATQMTLLLQESRAAAHELVGRTLVWNQSDGAGEFDHDTLAATSADERLVRAESSFEYYLAASLEDGGEHTGQPHPSAFAPWLSTLVERQADFRQNVATLQDLARTDADSARNFLDRVFDPFLQNELLPIVYGYRSEAEETLAEQLGRISSHAETTAHVAFATGAVALILAIVLSVLLWRSIHAPIRALGAAALRLGQGHLETRVEVRSNDELGVLGDTFNRMARELAATMVSVSDLENVFDSMAGALIIFDADGCIVRVNRAAQQLVGYDREEILGSPFARICPPTGGGVATSLATTSEDGIVVIEEKVFRRKDGSCVPVSFSGAELRTGTGPHQGYVCVAQDLTERKFIEERIRRSLAEKELLLREVHHRVKNNMQVVSSLLSIQSQNTRDARVREQFEQSQTRIRSMALIHEQLYQGSSVDEIDLRGYLEILIEHLLQSFDHNHRVTFELEVEVPASDVDRAVACGLIVNELVTNSLKHAFQGEDYGKIRVSLHEEAGEQVLCVADDGCGLPEPFAGDAVRKLGLTLVEQLAQQFDARVVFPNGPGTEVCIVFPEPNAQGFSQPSPEGLEAA